MQQCQLLRQAITVRWNPRHVVTALKIRVPTKISEKTSMTSPWLFQAKIQISRHKIPAQIVRIFFFNYRYMHVYSWFNPTWKPQWVNKKKQDGRNSQNTKNLTAAVLHDSNLNRQWCLLRIFTQRHEGVWKPCQNIHILLWKIRRSILSALVSNELCMKLNASNLIRVGM